jgi:hypothetical protein
LVNECFTGLPTDDPCRRHIHLARARAHRAEEHLRPIGSAKELGDAECDRVADPPEEDAIAREALRLLALEDLLDRLACLGAKLRPAEHLR